MTPAEAAKLLELPDTATPEQIEARFHEVRTKLEEKIGKAPTPGLKAKYRETLDEITAAFETLALAADSSALPVLRREQGAGSKEQGRGMEAGDGRPEAGGPASLRAGNGAAAAAPRGSDSGLQSPVSGLPPAKRAKSGGREFIVVALIAVAVLGAGGWWVVTTRAEKAEKARIAAEAKAEAERKAAAEKAEAELRAAEEKRLAEEKRVAEEAEKARVAAAEKAERERQEKLMAQVSAQLVNLRIAWEAAEQEERKAERRLNELRSDERTLVNAARGAAPDSKLRRLQAEVAAQAEFHDWISGQLGRHEAKVLRAQAEAMMSVRQFDEAARIVAQATAAQAKLDDDLKAMRAQMLTLAGSLKLDISPAAAEWVLTDAYGATRRGRGAGVVDDVPWGPVVLEAALPGYQPQRREAVLRRGEPLELGADFSPVVLRIDSLPQGAEIRLGGQPKGKTPETVEWAGDGEVELTLRLPGHELASYALNLASGESLELEPFKLAPLPKGLTRLDFAQGPLRYVVSSQTTHNYHNTDNSSATDDYISNTYSQTEQRWEIESPTGRATDATKVTVTTLSHSNNGQNVYHPQTVQEYIRTESGWYRKLIRGGAIDPNVQAYLKDGPVNASPIALRTALDHAGWWPQEPKKAGETWEVPLAVVRASGLAVLTDKNVAGSATGRVRSLRIDDNQQVAEVEFNFNFSSADATGDIKMGYTSTGRVTCTVDLKNKHVAAMSYTVENNNTSDAPIMLGMRLKGVTTSSMTHSMTSKPF